MEGAVSGDDDACLNVHVRTTRTAPCTGCNMSGLNSGMSNRFRSTLVSVRWLSLDGRRHSAQRLNGSCYNIIVVEKMMIHRQSIALLLLWVAAPLDLCDLIHIPV